MDKAERAFKWIVGVLNEEVIPFVFGGGIAARSYGATRPLFDIDLDIPEGRFRDLLPRVQKYVELGPQHFQDETFDLKLLTLIYEGQQIDIAGGESVRLFDRDERIWKPDPTDFVNVEAREIYGLIVPVVRKESLVRYKRWIARPTDLQDIAEIEAASETPRTK